MMSSLSWLLLIAILPPAEGDGDATPIPHPVLPPARLGELPRDEQAARSLAVTAWLEKEGGEFDQLEKITIQYELSNIDENIHIVHFGYDKYTYVFLNVIDGDGVEMPETCYHLANIVNTSGQSGSSVVSRHLKPGESFGDTFVANLICDMTRPGEYTIVVEIPFYVRYGASEIRQAVATSNPLKVRVKESE